MKELGEGECEGKRVRSELAINVKGQESEYFLKIALDVLAINHAYLTSDHLQIGTSTFFF